MALRAAGHGLRTCVIQFIKSDATVGEIAAQTPPQVCLVMTGRHAPPALIDLADTVTEMCCVKHGLRAGIAAQKGVER